MPILPRSQTLTCFNPRSHEGSDRLHQLSPSQSPVSIHAPTKGATVTASRKSPGNHCFNPRSHEGSDHEPEAKHYKLIGFNPRSHEGSDAMLTFISTVSLGFNPRSHEGSDALNPVAYALFRMFQSTLPRRERLWNDWFRDTNYQVSIHAPTKGATFPSV